MSVRQRDWIDATGKKHSAWMVDVKFRYADGSEKRVRDVSPVNTRRGAEEYERQIRASLLAGNFGKNRDVPAFRDFAPRFMAYIKGERAKPSYVMSAEGILEKNLLPTLGHLPINEIHTKHAARLVTDWAHLSPKTVNNRMSILRRALNLAVEWGELAFVPKIPHLDDRKKHREEFDEDEEADFRFLTFDQTDKALAFVAEKMPAFRPMLLVMLRTGIRIGEASALKWSAVDLERKRLHIRLSVYKGHETLPKGNVARYAALSDEAVEALKQQQAMRGEHHVYKSGKTAPRDGRAIVYRHDPSEYVFPNKYGQRRKSDAIYWHLAQVAAHLQIEPFGPHVLRHTFASQLAALGVPAREIQRQMGHQSITMTERYMHLAPATRRDPVALLDRAARRPYLVGTEEHGRGTSGAHGAPAEAKPPETKAGSSNPGWESNPSAIPDAVLRFSGVAR